MRFQQYNTFTQARRGLIKRGFTTFLNFDKGKLTSESNPRGYSPSELTLVEYHRFPNQEVTESGKIIFAFEIMGEPNGIMMKEYKSRLNLKLVSFIDSVPIKLGGN